MKKKYSLGWFLVFCSISIYSTQATTTPSGIASTTTTITTTSSTTITATAKLTTVTKVSSSTQGVSCATLRTTLIRTQESSEVMALQSFLSEKGLLQATPNGYFGVGTLAAVKAFQKSKAITPIGIVGPKTREAIAKETCIRPLSQYGTSSFTVGSSSLPQGQVTTSSSTKVTMVATSTRIRTPLATTIQQSIATSTSTIPVTPTPSSLRNTKRREHIEVLLKALYARYNDSRGTHPVSITDTPIELCVLPPVVIATGTTTEVAVLETPVSPCATFVDVSYLSPSYLLTIPRDPSVATTSMLLGYTITRSEYNDITIAAKNPEDKAILQAKCNFNSYCKDITYTSTSTYKKPVITSFNRSSFLRDSVPVTPIIILGKNFTNKNTISLLSNYSSKKYSLGNASSTDGVTIHITPEMLNQQFSCGVGCTEKLPLGDFSISVTNEGGESNNFYITLQGFTTDTLSSHNDTSVTPKSTNIKVASITIGTAITLSMKSLVLTSTSSVTTLPSKIKNFVLKEQSTGIVRGSGGTTLTFPDETLYENTSKVYDLYVDVDEALAGQGGFISYGGYFLANDPFFSLDMNIPIKEFSFSVSY